MKRFTFPVLVLSVAGFATSVSVACDGAGNFSNRSAAETARKPLSYSYFSPYDDDKNEIDSDEGATAIDNDKTADAQESLFDRTKKQDSDPIWSRKPIQNVRIDIREKDSVAPQDRSAELEYGTGDFNQFYPQPKVFAWAAPNIYYQPLYFEDVPLERYGQTTGIKTQPVRSAGHFFKSVVFFPNHLRHDHPFSCDYPLGFCRPGSNVPCTKQIQYLGLFK